MPFGALAGMQVGFGFCGGGMQPASTKPRTRIPPPGLQLWAKCGRWSGGPGGTRDGGRGLKGGLPAGMTLRTNGRSAGGGPRRGLHGMGRGAGLRFALAAGGRN